MKIERIKKSHKKEIVVGGLILVSIVSAITLVTTRAKYKVTQDIKLVNGTVNYKVPDLRVVAINISDDGNNYTNTNEIPTDGYELNSSKSICKVYDGTTSIEEAPKDNNITIEYKEGKINILGVSKKNTRCYLYFDKKKEPTGSETILANITPKDGTPTFANVATTDEGVYSVSDGMYGGTSYYWRGAATTNYIKFASFCWRIIRINGDGSIRLIYDGSTCHTNGTNTDENIVATSQLYNGGPSKSEHVGWTSTISSQRPLNNATAAASNAKSQTDTWYNNNIGNNDTYKEKVADGKFCNDRESEGWASKPSIDFYYAASRRLVSAMTPTLSCQEGDVYILKVGAITADEVAYAGGKYGTANSSYYLYNGQHYWTMSPAASSSSSGDSARVFNMLSYGGLGFGDVDWVYPGIRPVINLKADTTFSSGDGTQSNPYVVS